jgi:hypothetical protein
MPTKYTTGDDHAPRQGLTGSRIPRSGRTTYGLEEIGTYGKPWGSSGSSRALFCRRKANWHRLCVLPSQNTNTTDFKRVIDEENRGSYLLSIHPTGVAVSSRWNGPPPKGERDASHDPPLALSQASCLRPHGFGKADGPRLTGQSIGFCTRRGEVLVRDLFVGRFFLSKNIDAMPRDGTRRDSETAAATSSEGTTQKGRRAVHFSCILLEI